MALSQITAMLSEGFLKILEIPSEIDDSNIGSDGFDLIFWLKI